MQDGEVITCDHAIVTVSAGVLKAEMDDMFYPPLPERKRRAIQDVGE